MGIDRQVSTKFGQIIEKVKKGKHHVNPNPIILPLNSTQDDTKNQSQHATARKTLSDVQYYP
jgi:hypothetical protein